MGYSKIVSFSIANFMSVKYAKLVFDESGIIIVKGYNDSGKSAILRALVVCMMDLFSRKQSKLIRHGEDGFRVEVEFDDGVIIIRDKYINGQSLYEMYKDGKLLYTSKEGSKLTKISGVPKPIEEYLGLCMIPSGCLNYQSCTDLLLLVDTVGSFNYETLHEVLKIEQISKANKLINSDINELNSEIAEIEAELNASEIMLNEMYEISDDLLLAMSERETVANDLEVKMDKVENLHSIMSDICGIAKMPDVPKIDDSRCSDIEALSGLLSSLSMVDSLPKVERVNATKLEKVLGLHSVAKTLLNLSSVLPDVPKVDEQHISMLESLKALEGTYNELYDVVIKQQKCKKDLKSLKIEINDLVDKAKKKGYVFAKCNNCGSYVNVKVGEDIE